ncbi:MAG: thiol:disulfide interchange protein DsbA/DsbL [Pseudomonadales bacterium]
MSKKKSSNVALVRNLIIAAVAIVVALVVGYGLLYTSGVTQGEFVEGEHYQVLPDAPRRRPGAPIVVQEFFSYGCIHCRNFDPLVEEWLPTLPEGVRFERVPVAFSPDWSLLGQTYYALDALGILAENHERIFARIHDRRDFFDSAAEVADFVDGHGTTADVFLATVNGPDVRRRMRDADNAQRRVGLTAVPTLVVDGTYVVTMDVGRKVALEVVDYLIAQQLAGTEPDTAPQ